jgi:pimeloyl-ACP methyl ester carboxylesterase
MSDTNPTSGSTDIGVLVVHGIGNQAENATLGEFDDALVGSLRRWLGPAAVAGRLQPADGDTPAHAHVTLDDRDGEPLRALVAEGYWADTVLAPQPGTLLRWLLAVVPFVVPRVLDGGLRRNSERMDRLRRSRAPHRLAGFAGLSLWRLVQNVVVVGVTLALLAVLVATWLLAVPRALYDRLSRSQLMRPFARRGVAVVGGLVVGVLVVKLGVGLSTELQMVLVVLFSLGAALAFTLPRLVNTVLGNFVGDCYALLCDPDTERAMVGRVEERLAWLESQVGDAPVVVVAHSQGTEIARRVLAERDRPVRGLVTLGSAIAKLGAVGYMRDAPWRYTGAFALRICSAVMLVLAVVIAAGSWTDPWQLLPAAVLVAVAAAAFTAGRAVLRLLVLGEHPDERPLKPCHVGRWVDFYTSADPVPEGELTLITKSWGYSREIVNSRVPLLDHVKYWSNVQGFCATVALELGEMAGRPRGEAMRESVATAARDRARALALRVRLGCTLVLAAISSLVVGEGSTSSRVLAAATIAAAIAIRCVLARRAKAIAGSWAPCARREARREAARQAQVG